MNNKLTLEELEQLSYDEARNLSMHTTWEEKTKLIKAFKREILDGDSITDCIYGTMTDNCYSERALVLLEFCALPFVKNLLKPRFSFQGSFQSTRYTSRYYSTIEYLLLRHNTKGPWLTNIINIIYCYD